ncbi:hypothetical protein CBL_20799 [Carabus blaptoides fortunei]
MSVIRLWQAAGSSVLLNKVSFHFPDESDVGTHNPPSDKANIYDFTTVSRQGLSKLSVTGKRSSCKAFVFARRNRCIIDGMPRFILETSSKPNTDTEFSSVTAVNLLIYVRRWPIVFAIKKLIPSSAPNLNCCCFLCLLVSGAQTLLEQLCRKVRGVCSSRWAIDSLQRFGFTTKFARLFPLLLPPHSGCWYICSTPGYCTLRAFNLRAVLFEAEFKQSVHI